MAPVSSRYLFLVLRDDGEDFRLQYLKNSIVDFEIHVIRWFEQKQCIVQDFDGILFVLIRIVKVFNIDW